MPQRVRDALADLGRGRVESLKADVRGCEAAIRELIGGAGVVGARAYQEANSRVRARKLDVDRNRTGGGDAVAEAVGTAVDEHAPRARRWAEELAPGIASAPLDVPGSAAGQHGTTTRSHVRVGHLDHAADPPVPVVVPLLGTSGWVVRSDDAAAAYRLIQNVTLRLVGSLRPFGVRIDSYDPRLSGAMGLHRDLSDKHPEIVAEPLTKTEELKAKLSELLAISSQRAGRLTQLGHERFEDLIEDSSHVVDPYRLVVLFDYPAGIDDETQQELTRLASSARDRGICFLVHSTQNTPLESGIDTQGFETSLEQVQIADGVAGLDHLPGVPVRADGPVDISNAASICAGVNEAAARAALPTIDFETTLPPRSQWWQPAADELNTVVGLDDRTPVTLRLRSGNPALPHILVGGAVGQGKSNFLLMLIHGLAARYAPRDLEMYLLDFKHGLEFAALGPSRDAEPYWLPHLRVLGVHSDRPFGLAVLNHLGAEQERRSNLFKARGHADISEFGPGPDRPPRILLVLDEFQVMFEDEDIAEDVARRLDTLVRQGRAYGIHVVLATQTVEGLQRLATRRDAIFGQIPYRVALKSTRADSQALLQSHNTAAADLRFRGEAILNSDFGSPTENQHLVVGHADRETVAQLRHDLWSMAGDVRPPRMFHLGESANLPEVVWQHPDRHGGRLPAWAGMPISVSEIPDAVDLRPEPGAGVLVLGDGPHDAAGVLTGLALSIVANSDDRPRFVVLDGTPGTPESEQGKASLLDALDRLGCTVDVARGPDSVVTRLAELREAIRSDGVERPTYVLGFGMHGVAQMTTTAPGEFESPADDLRAVVRDGPAQEVFTLAWWNRLHVCTEHLGFDRCNVSTYVFLSHPQDGVRSVAGPLVRWRSEAHRALIWDGVGAEPRVVVPFAPLEASDVDPLVRELAR